MSQTKMVALMHDASSKNRRDLHDEMDLADELGCVYIDYSDVRSLLDELGSMVVDEGKLNGAAYGALRDMAEAQLSFGRSIFMASPIEPAEYRAHLEGLVVLADAYGVPLTVIEVKRESKEDKSQVKVDPDDIPHLILPLEDSEHFGDRCAQPDIDFFPSVDVFIRYFDSMPEFVNNGGYTIPDTTVFRHFSHRHPLLLNTSDQDQGNEEKKDLCCSICTASIAGQPYYSCPCCGFFLHKQCADLPQHVKSPIHLHPLRLVIATWEKSGRRLFRYRSYTARNPEFKIKCLVCDSEEQLPFYGCFHCPDLFVHQECIRSLQHVIQHRLHPHPLTLEMVKTYWFLGHHYKCYACGGLGDRIGYCCRECKFDFHLKCVLSLPPYVHHNRHANHHANQPLYLSIPPKDETNEYYCEVCAERRHPDYWIYYCRSCKYEAHPHCVLEGIPSYNYEEEQETGPAAADDDDEGDAGDKSSAELIDKMAEEFSSHVL